jgi:hypothetical protein
LAYRLVITGAARKDLDQLPKDVLERADPKILALAENPRPFGSTPQERLQETLVSLRLSRKGVADLGPNIVKPVEQDEQLALEHRLEAGVFAYGP